MCPGIDESAVSTGKAEESDGQVLGQQLVESDYSESLDKANLVFGEVSEQHGGVSCSDVSHIIIYDLRFAEECAGIAESGILLPDVVSGVILDFGKLPEGLVVEHE